MGENSGNGNGVCRYVRARQHTFWTIFGLKQPLCRSPFFRLRVQLRARKMAVRRPGESDGFRLICCTCYQASRTFWEFGIVALALLCGLTRGYKCVGKNEMVWVNNTGNAPLPSFFSFPFSGSEFQLFSTQSSQNLVENGPKMIQDVYWFPEWPLSQIHW